VLARLDKKRAREITPDAVRASRPSPTPGSSNFKSRTPGTSGRGSGVWRNWLGGGLRIHDLRHFAASTLTSAGIEDNIIGLLTGHKSRNCDATSISGKS